VLADRDTLFEFERDYPRLEATLTALLRTYEGIVDQPVNINEKMIALSIRKTEEDVVNDLLSLHRFRIINYIPRKDKPQVYLFFNRQRGDDLQLDMQLVEKRKLEYLERVGAITNFVRTSTLCRSVMIGNYFGDKNIQPCGVCDSCINKKKESQEATPFADVYSMLENELKQQPVSLREILSKNNSIPAERVKEVLRFLVAEQKVDITDTGKISLKNTSLSASSTKS
jgi:ATP-dependent DNA helicase RecQ